MTKHWARFARQLTLTACTKVTVYSVVSVHLCVILLLSLTSVNRLLATVLYPSDVYAGLYFIL